MPVLLTQEPGDFFTTRMLVPTAEYEASRYFREYAKPINLGDGLSAVLTKNDGVVHFLAMAKPVGGALFSDDDIENLRLLTPHIRRAHAIGKLIRGEQRESEALSLAFDSMQSAIFLVEPNLSVVHLNDAARRLLAGREMFHVSAGVLSIADNAARLELIRAVRAAAPGKAGTASSVVLREADADKYIAHVLPLSGAEGRRTFGGGRASAALFITSADFDAKSPIELVHRRFQLTTAEAMALVSVVETGAPKAAAEELGVSEHTVKSHLKKIFLKTGVRSQAELVKLLAKYGRPRL